LDALAARLPPGESGTLVVVQNHLPDRFFGDSQQLRLEELMARWRTARDTGQALSSIERTELNSLVDAEVQASGKRAAAALARLRK
jgi:hypothetical protein